jgi:hypothetical protein
MAGITIMATVRNFVVMSLEFNIVGICTNCKHVPECITNVIINNL